jgi:hypothetical protein
MLSHRGPAAPARFPVLRRAATTITMNSHRARQPTATATMTHSPAVDAVVFTAKIIAGPPTSTIHDVTTHFT